MNVLQRVSALLLLLIVALPIQNLFAADAGVSDRLRLSGFATLGLTKAGNDYLGYHRDLYRKRAFDGDWTMTADSLLGVQLDARITDALSGAVQVVAKDRIENTFENSLEWAFLRYRFNPDWTLRAGRIGLDVFMLSEYRSLGFSYLWSRPPVEFYTPVAFDSFDGFDIEWSTPVGDGMLRAKLFGGQTSSDFNVSNEGVEIKLSPAAGVSLNWDSDHWQLRVTAATNQLDSKTGYFPGTERLADGLIAAAPLWAAAEEYSDFIATENDALDYYAMGAAYNRSFWQVQAEVGYIDSQVNLYPSILNGYISLGRQFDAVTVFGLVASVQSREDHRQAAPAPSDAFLPPQALQQLAALQQGMQILFDSIGIEQTTGSLGLRWDVRYDLALKAQWDRTWVDRYGSALWGQRAIPDKDQIINTFSINLNCIF